MKMDVSNVLQIIEQEWDGFEKSKRLNFRDFVEEGRSWYIWRPKRGVLECKGVYIVFHGDTPIYVGSGGKGGNPLKYRIADLFSYSLGYRGSEKGKFYHTLTRKLVEERIKPSGLSLGQARTTPTRVQRKMTILQQALDHVRIFYLQDCSFKVVETSSINEARMLEQVFILMLSPKYNG